jgi:hypothetical protein
MLINNIKSFVLTIVLIGFSAAYAGSYEDYFKGHRAG